MGHRMCGRGLRRALNSAWCKRWVLAFGFAVISAIGSSPTQAQEMCGGKSYPFPYTDVSGVGAAFCPGIMEAYVTGVTKGTTPTTFSPNDDVTRLQMTTFLQRSLDQGLTRASRRTVLKRLWPVASPASGFIQATGSPVFCAADGDSVWVTTQGEVLQVQASTNIVLNTWTGATGSWPVFPIPGFVAVADNGAPGHIWFVDPSAPGAVIGGDDLPGGPSGITYDGTRVWIADFSGSVSIDTPGVGVTNVSAGFVNPVSVLFDGTQVWVTDFGAGKLFAVDSSGHITKSVTVGAGPEQSLFDGENIWVPNSGDSSITVVQASTGNIVATIAPDGFNLLSGPEQVAFDGERILVTNSKGHSLTLFKAADLSLIGNVALGSLVPYGACSDGINFWVTFVGSVFVLEY